MRINLTKKDLVNSIYMQLGFSKLISENLIDDFIQIIIQSFLEEKKIKLSRFGTFEIRHKRSRIGRNPKTMEKYSIPSRKTIIFKPSKKITNKLNNLYE